jgi:predicted transcriptional regulator
MGFVVLAVWVGYRRVWGDATSTLLKHGLHDMTVRDVGIVGQIMNLKEFTVPELMKLTKTSKITVWRTVQKLVERGLVQPTPKTRLAANGLGGRGKPSRVYKYIGVKGSPKEETGSISKHQR